MATDLGSSRIAKTATSGKHDAFVQAQLTRAEKRIRLLDVGAALLGFAAIVCVFVAALALADHAWALPAWLRQISLAVFVLGSGVYLYCTLARPLVYRVNPYYAAQRVEETMPGAKNSVVNWLDLQDQKLPPAIRNAVGQKAAKDLSQADVERAISSRRLALVGGAAAGCAAGLLVCLFVAGSASLQRVLAPFSFGSSPSRITITIKEPTNGDDTVTVGRAVYITARVEGKVPDSKSPDAVRVQYRYQEDEPYLERMMRPSGDEFKTTISAADLRDGFWYKVAAGGVETPEYRINVRATPLLTAVQATYHFRPYVAREDELHYGKRPFRMEALRGTEITLVVNTNRPVKEAALVLEGKDGQERYAAETLADDPKAFRLKFVVEKTTRYRLEYRTADTETYVDPRFQEIVAVPDLPPDPVKTTSPGRDIQLPCNGVLQVEGSASDDVGVKSLTLHMQVTKGPQLQAKPYRSDKELRLPNGGYPRTIAYKDFVDLKTVHTADGKPFPLAAGMELEYWLEASDACDYPKPNVSESESQRHFRVLLLEPEEDKEKLNNQEQQAKQEQQQHEAKQNDALKNEDKARRDEQERRNEEARHEKEETRGQSAKPDEPKKEPKEGSQKNPNESKDNTQGNKPNEAANPDQQKRDKETERQANQLKKELEKNRKKEQQEQHGTSKPDKASEAAKPSENKELGKKPDPQNAPSEPKPEGKPDSKQPPSAPKQPPKADMKKDAAKKKEEGKPSDQVCPKGECKNGGMSLDSKTPMPKDKPSPASNKSEGKNAGAKPGNDPKAQPKPGGNPSSGESKPTPSKPDSKDPAKAESKQDKVSGNSGEAGQADPKNAKPDDVSKLEKGLKSENGQARKDAAQQLEKIAEKAKDEKAREQAKQALEQAGQKPTPESEPKPLPDKGGPDGKGEEPCKAKGDHGSKQMPTGTAKGGEKGKEDVPKSDQKPLSKPTIDDKTPEPTDPAQKEELQKKREEYLKKVEEDLRKQGKFDEKEWKEFLERNGDKIKPPDMGDKKGRPDFVPEERLLPPDNEGPPVIKDNTPRDNKATLLQLRKFQEAIDKKTLAKAGFTPEQWREFIKNYADLARRQDPLGETLPDPKNTGTMSGIGRVRVNPGAKIDPNDLRGSGRSQPPPAYRDAWRQFTRDLSSANDKK